MRIMVLAHHLARKEELFNGGTEMSELEAFVEPVSKRVRQGQPCVVRLWVRNRSSRTLYIPFNRVYGQEDPYAFIPFQIKCFSERTQKEMPYQGPIYKIAGAALIPLMPHGLLGAEVDLREFYKLPVDRYRVVFWYDSTRIRWKSIGLWYDPVRGKEDPIMAKKVWRGRTNEAEAIFEVVP